jgi:uncharacterized membrane protein YbhN (UPF0104 family)
MRLSAVTLGKMVVSVAVVTWVLSRINLAELLTVMGKAHIGLLVLAFSLHGVGLLLSAKRWEILLSIEKIDLSFKAIVLTYWIGSFFNSFLPGSVGGDVVRSYLVSRDHGKLMQTVITVIFERVAGVVALLAIFGIGVIWLYMSPDVALGGVLPAGGALFYGGHMIVSARRTEWTPGNPKARWGVKFDNLCKSIFSYGAHKRELCSIFFLSILLQINVIIYYSVVAAALDIHLAFVYFCLLIPPVLIVTMLPISFGGLGVREAAFLFFFSALGTTSAEILSLSLWSYMLALLANLSGGLVYSFHRPSYR